jgi:hypothetical protein
MEVLRQKIKVDIVFLVDATGSMGNCIYRLKENIMLFFRKLTGLDPEVRAIPFVGDWRAKVVGFRDVEVDDDKWFEDNCFTRDIAEVERQLGSLTADGGGDRPESLLDAIYKVGAAPKSEKGEEAPTAWRYRSDAKRVVIAFTDAPYKPTMTAPGLVGGTVNDLVHLCLQERILLTVVAPEGIDDDGFETLASIRYANWVSVPSGAPQEDAPLDEFVNNHEALRHTLSAIAKHVCYTCDELDLL